MRFSDRGRTKLHKGYAALMTVLVALGVSLTVVGSLTFFSLNEVRANRAYIRSIEARTAAESGVEDVTYRLVAGKNTAASETLGVGNATTTTTLIQTGDQYIVRAEGTNESHHQSIEAQIDTTTDSTSFFYGVQVDAGGVTMGNGARVNGNLFSNGSISGGRVTGTAVVAAGNTQISNATIDISARAPAFNNATVGGSACPNANCVIASDASQPLPISDGLIQDWRDEAAAGGTIGSYNVSGSQSLDPVKINGNLTMSNGATLIVRRPIWITGTMTTSNGSTVRCDSGLGINSCVIIADGNVHISNNTTMTGSGTAGSYILVVGARNATASQVMNISNNSTGAIFYAPHGRIQFNNNAAAKEVSGYGFDMDNNAIVTYELGLQNLHFTAGPSGGYDLKHWKPLE